MLPVVDQLRKDLAGGVPRSTAWAKVEQALPPSPLRFSVHRHSRLLRLLEASRRKHRLPVPPASGSSILGAARASTEPLCRGCGVPKSQHRDKTVHRRHMFILCLRANAKRQWRARSADERKRIMEIAWAGRRKAKNERLLATVHPRLLKVLGRKEVLARFGRQD